MSVWSVVLPTNMVMFYNGKCSLEYNKRNENIQYGLKSLLLRHVLEYNIIKWVGFTQSLLHHFESQHGDGGNGGQPAIL